MRTLATPLVLASAALLAGCVSPRPASRTEPAQPPSSAPMWTSFGDTNLVRVMTLVLERNRDLTQAGARIDESRAKARLAGADGTPQVRGRATAGRDRMSETTDNPLAPGPCGTLAARLELSYEADLWGRLDAARRAARQQVILSEADRSALEITLLARTATLYFQRQGGLAEAALLERQIAAYAEAIQVQDVRAKAGFAPALERERMEVERSARQLELDGLRLQARQTAHALALLCGVPPEELVLPDCWSSAALPPPPRTLPMEWLDARPDVAAARAAWESAKSRAEAARAARYPSLVFTGAIGLETNSARDLLDWRSRLWNLVGGLTAPLLDGGRLGAQFDVERARVRAAAAEYEQKVLTAHREVADALQALDTLLHQEAEAACGRDAAARLRALSGARHTAGLVSYLEVLESDRSHWAAERAVVQVETRRRVASVDLARALARPWDDGGR